jgi:dienelactone hydrolase
MEERAIEYEHAGIRMHAIAFVPEGAKATKLPGILVAHDWRGRHAFAIDEAKKLASFGFVTFALDMYGDAKVGAELREYVALMQPLADDRALLMARINAALAALKAIPEVDVTRTAALGFCFGGKCVLDLARSGADVTGVVSLHGLLDGPPKELCKPARARVLVLHGFRDPMAPPEHLVALGHELLGLGADVQLHAYGSAMHAFTNPAANQPERGAVYDELTRERAYRLMHDFFLEIFMPV